MDGVFLGGSILAAFVAGSVALFAPCCITVMFPAYLAAAVRNNRWRLIPLTMIFAAGVAIVLVPLTLGLTVLTRALLGAHTIVYAVGGLLMLMFAGFAATGGTWSLPFLRGSPDIARTDSGGVFALGVFSGAASACCAPVLAGVVAMSAVAPGLFEGTAIGLSYVFGMVFPLVVITLLWDRSGLAQAGRLESKPVTWKFASRTFTTTRLSLWAAALFVLMGVVLLVVAATGATLAPTFQRGLAEWLERTLTPVVQFFGPIPDFVVGLVLVGLAVGAVVLSSRRRTSEPSETDHGRMPHDKSCQADADRDTLDR